jgi:HlyD family secretion protein
MDAVRVRAGTRVMIENWGGGRTLEGRVRRVEPAGFMRVSALGVEEQRVPVLVEISTPREQWSELGLGFRVEASFILWAGENVMQIPANALFRAGGEWRVFVVENERLSLRTVEPGRQGEMQTQILSGLKTEERVVMYPGDRLADGLRVAIER